MDKEKVIDISFFNPKRPHVKAEVRAASITIFLWACAWILPVFLIWITGDEKGIGPLTKAKFLGFPLHYWLLAQGSTISFVLLCALFVYLWNKFVKAGE
ncbi:DUF4212 domain-containing protein [Deferribacter autotrophicus]|uniref:DUF4212 domain-containing protein n=1 Tax=Deferribacter autotrophicus TaxID=500465 RepID=A0A5A8F631_9BACT|nr:sodium/substrate symporter small subunit [Deferribacter autotrophicus]KAA0257078.1 DUF4212 domain-containing protein [Deferribacter autotrophicus]